MSSIKIYDNSLTEYDSSSLSYDGLPPEGIVYKEFLLGSQLSAFDVNKYLMNQVVMSFTNSSQRSTQLSGYLSRGMVSYTADSGQLSVYNATIWERLAFQGNVLAIDPSQGQKRIYMR